MGLTDKECIIMPCYHPFIRYENINRPIKANDGHTYYKSTIERPNDIWQRLEELKSNINYKAQIIPCGSCIGCKLEYSRQWATRAYLESKLYKQNYFVTITYDEENLVKNEEIITSEGISYYDEEWNGTLVPQDLTQFIKNVRQIMKREYGKTGVRFLACGEYGEEGERPHYHIIFLNLELPMDTFYKPKVINNEIYYQNKIIERAWKKGISNITEATWSTMAYTARYITKKINGKQSEDYYAEKGQDKEFFRVSRMPGIGKPYYDLYKNKIYKYDNVTIKNKQGAIACKPPKYFDELYKQEYPEEFKKIKKRREKLSNDYQKIKDSTHSYGRLEHLAIEEVQKIDQTLKLIRTFEAKKKKNQT